MAIKILSVQGEGFAPNWPGAEAAEIDNLSTQLKKGTPEDPAANLVLAPASFRRDSRCEGLLNAGFPATFLFLPKAENADVVLSRCGFLSSDKRTTGVKDCLAKGSTIFSESFFNASKAGEKLDQSYRFARGKLSPRKSVEVWGALHSLLFLAIRSLPEQGEKGTGEKVDLQIGADNVCLALSVRFDLPAGQLLDVRRHSFLEVARSATDFFEVRFLQSGQKAEILLVSFLDQADTFGIEAQSFHPHAALEGKQDAKDYTFETFASLKGASPEEKKPTKAGAGGFKKKFSEKVKAVEPKTEIAEPGKATEEKIADADAGNFLVAGEVLQPTKPVVSGNATLASEKAAISPEGFTPPSPTAPAKGADAGGKSVALLESKIQSLETTLKQREELVTKLNKEIAEIKDPAKMNVISNIKDNQVEGLKANLNRLEGELAEAAKREKELMTVVDKAIQMKDEAVKKFKEVDTKLKQSQGGNNSKVVTLEKTLEEQKRQNKELSKRVSSLTEQLLAAGKRVA